MKQSHGLRIGTRMRTSLRMERIQSKCASESATCIFLTCPNLKTVVHSTVQVYADVVFTKMSVPANGRHGSVVLMWRRVGWRNGLSASPHMIRNAVEQYKHTVYSMWCECGCPCLCLCVCMCVALGCMKLGFYELITQQPNMMQWN